MNITDTVKVAAHNVKMIAHRGVSGLEKENTCAAFVAAGNRSYFGIETDVHKTGDGNFVIIHDLNTSRISHDNINVEEIAFDTLRQIQLCDTDGIKSRTDLRIPSLDEYISICKKYEKCCVLELKSDFTDFEIEAIIDHIEKLGWLRNVIFISFVYDNLLKVRKLRPSQKCEFLTSEIGDDVFARLVADKIDLDVYFMALTEERVKALHEAGIEINCFTVDKKEDAERMISWGVDYITSNILEGNCGNL